ncbi:MAG: ABC transporter ATP-binding protein [Cyanobacteriota bacterium]
MLFKSLRPSKSNPEATLSSHVSICAEDITMFFQSGKQEIPILKGIDWEANKGSIQLLMGPSGSGKTTFLSILAGLLTPTQGQVYLLGKEITRLSRKKRTAFRRQHIGFIFQNFNLFPALTAAENIEIILNVKGIKGEKARYEAQKLLEEVGLELYANQKPKDLSGGQKQRVAIARALAGNPPLIMADEPTAALDSTSGHRVTELLRRLAKENNATVLIVTHDPRIRDVADQITYLEDGVLKEQN